MYVYRVKECVMPEFKLLKLSINIDNSLGMTERISTTPVKAILVVCDIVNCETNCFSSVLAFQIFRNKQLIIAYSIVYVFIKELYVSWIQCKYLCMYGLHIFNNIVYHWIDEIVWLHSLWWLWPLFSWMNIIWYV